MERLTLNKATDEMGMWGLAHNCCYAKDGVARYRDFEIDIDARDFARKLMVEYGHWKSCEKFGLDADNELIDDDIFDETMLENLMCGQKESIGLIALFYRNLWAMADLHGKLKEYEDLDEQGLLLKLPCYIESDVYFIPSKVNFELNKLNGYENNNRVYHQKVAKIVFNEHGWYLECDKDLEYGTGHILIDKYYKETWFLTQTEAEEALKRMGGN